MDKTRVPVLGVGFDNVDMDEAVARALTLLDDGGYIVTPNAEIVYDCRKNEDARTAVNGASLVIPDGIGVVYAARILGSPLKARVPGIELGEHLLPHFVRLGKTLFLYGGRPGVAARAAQRLQKKYPGLRIAGVQDGFVQDEDAVVRCINDAAPDALYVCLGAPRQELWMRRNAHRLRVRLMLGLGGAIDGYAGDVDRAPAFYRDHGLEWLHRLLLQPSRIGRMTRLPRFLLLVLHARLRGHTES